MKRVVWIMMLISVFMFFGCKKVAVEDVAKDHVKKQFKLVDNAKLDLSKLKYTVIKKEGDKATVNISGPIQYDEQIILVKDGRKWKIEEKRAQQKIQPKQAEQSKKTEQDKQHASH